MAPPSGTDGVSLVPELFGIAEHTRTHVFNDTARRIVNRYPSRWMRSVRDDRFKLVTRLQESKALFDLDADPFETRNLLDETLTPEAEEALRALEEHLELLRAEARAAIDAHTHPPKTQ